MAELGCGHSQHIRHAPPFRLAPWVLDDDERNARIGVDISAGYAINRSPRDPMSPSLLFVGRGARVASGGVDGGLVAVR